MRARPSTARPAFFLQRSREECTTVDGTDGTDETRHSIGLSSPCWILHKAGECAVECSSHFPQIYPEYTTFYDAASTGEQPQLLLMLKLGA